MSTEYKIGRLGHQGDGIADGPIYAPRTLPGEIVTGILHGNQLDDIRIRIPSEDRVQPPCRHYKSCGGCQLQHASDQFVSDWKQEIVQSALSARGLDCAFRPIVTSPPGSRRRATFSVRRTKKGAMAGFHARASDVIVQIPDCRLLAPGVLAGIPVAEALAVLGASRKGALSVAMNLSNDGLDVSVTGGKLLDVQLRTELAGITEQFGLARLSWDDEVIAMRAPPHFTFGRAQAVPPPGAFLQATAPGEDALLSAVKSIVGNASHVADLFAGCGTFGLQLAETSEVHAVEGDAEMVHAMDQAWRNAQGLRRVTTETRDLFRRPLTSDELDRFDAVVLDPPRAGAEAQVAVFIPKNIETIAYVSCNPITFARDARQLVSAGYKLDWLQVIDQFRWSSHVELVASFSHS